MPFCRLPSRDFLRMVGSAPLRLISRFVFAKEPDAGEGQWASFLGNSDFGPFTHGKTRGGGEGVEMGKVE